MYYGCRFYGSEKRFAIDYARLLLMQRTRREIGTNAGTQLNPVPRYMPTGADVEL